MIASGTFTTSSGRGFNSRRYGIASSKGSAKIGVIYILGMAGRDEFQVGSSTGAMAFGGSSGRWRWHLHSCLAAECHEILHSVG